MPPNPEALYKLATFTNETEAQLIAGALRARDIECLVLGGSGRDSGYGVVPTPITIEIRAKDHDAASQHLQELAEQLAANQRAIDSAGCCMLCRYDMAGLPDATICPECGTNLEDFARDHLRFVLAPPPGDPSLTQRFGVAMGWAMLLILIGLGIFCGVGDFIMPLLD